MSGTFFKIFKWKFLIKFCVINILKIEIFGSFNKIIYYFKILKKCPGSFVSTKSVDRWCEFVGFVYKLRFCFHKLFFLICNVCKAITLSHTQKHHKEGNIVRCSSLFVILDFDEGVPSKGFLFLDFLFLFFMILLESYKESDTITQ